jgi:hypothetical protein
MMALALSLLGAGYTLLVFFVVISFGASALLILQLYLPFNAAAAVLGCVFVLAPPEQ